MIIRQAQQSDLEYILRWRQEAARWLASRGSDQWSDVGLSDEAFTTRVQKSISDGETWMAVSCDRPVGTIAVDEWTDEGLWTNEEVANGVFVHRMIIDRDFAGQGVGAALLDQAAQLAASKGKAWIRLDAWTSNQGLHRYYESHGFQHVRTVENHHSPSAALFARPVSNAVIMQSTIKRPVIEHGGPDHGNPTPPDHWHHVNDLAVHDPYRYPQEGPLAVPSDTSPLHLWHDGDAWLVASTPSTSPYGTAKQVLSWGDAPHLDQERCYTISHKTSEYGCQLVLR